MNEDRANLKSLLILNFPGYFRDDMIRLLFWNAKVDEYLERGVFGELRASGYQPEQSASLKSDPNKYDAVFLGIMMAKKLGDNRVRSIQPPVVIVAVDSNPEESMHYLNSGRPPALAQDYIEMVYQAEPFLASLDHLKGINLIDE
ncbi:hypothetical protein A3K63_03105 [Candidatus Micrarchaeota archaeon RBG_16_49_10]|nr:MAG: hypothetical protein A3K63_03105 [Candidatus Micrarchaeota archaeon RBG_16_49_10]